MKPTRLSTLWSKKSKSPSKPTFQSITRTSSSALSASRAKPPNTSASSKKPATAAWIFWPTAIPTMPGTPISKSLVPDKQYENPKSVAKAIADFGGPDHLTVTEFKPNPSTKATLSPTSRNPTTLSCGNVSFASIHEGDAANSEAEIIGHSMIESDIKAFYQQPWVMVASDGGIGSAHPRGAGTFPAYSAASSAKNTG